MHSALLLFFFFHDKIAYIPGVFKPALLVEYAYDITSYFLENGTITHTSHLRCWDSVLDTPAILPLSLYLSAKAYSGIMDWMVSPSLSGLTS